MQLLYYTDERVSGNIVGTLHLNGITRRREAQEVGGICTPLGKASMVFWSTEGATVLFLFEGCIRTDQFDGNRAV